METVKRQLPGMAPFPVHTGFTRKLGAHTLVLQERHPLVKYLKKVSSIVILHSKLSRRMSFEKFHLAEDRGDFEAMCV